MRAAVASAAATAKPIQPATAAVMAAPVVTVAATASWTLQHTATATSSGRVGR